MFCDISLGFASLQSGCDISLAKSDLQGDSTLYTAVLVACLPTVWPSLMKSCPLANWTAKAGGVIF